MPGSTQHGLAAPVTDDLIVFVPGITGTTLIDAAGHEIWGLSGGSLLSGLISFGNSVRRLALPPHHGDAPAPDGVRPGKVFPTIHGIPGLWTPVNGYSQIVEFLRRPRFGLIEDDPSATDGVPGNLIVVPYDWRLSNRHTAQLLKDRVEPALERWRASRPQRAEAKVLFIGHSMGGLICRWYIERLGGREITRTLVTLGTPHRGSVKSLENLVNGTRRGFGPFNADFTAFGRSLPSSYQLLPEYACIDDGTHVHKKLSEVAVPALDSALVADGQQFLAELAEWPICDYAIVPITGIRQPTWTTARFESGRVVTNDKIRDPEQPGGWHDLRGDGTVPRLAAQPRGMPDSDDAPIHATQEGHGALAGHRDVLLQLERMLTARAVTFRGSGDDHALGVSVDDWHGQQDEVVVSVRYPTPRVLEVRALRPDGAAAATSTVRFEADDDHERFGQANLGRLPEGAYVIETRASNDPTATVPPVHATTVVWG